MPRSLLAKRIRALLDVADQGLVQGGLQGIEKECLRVAPSGQISQRGHPTALGSALTNRFITTDYSEAQLEFVTPTFIESWKTLKFLCDVHRFVYDRLDDELLWVTSMPCAVAGEDSIPIATYGDSNVGTMKHVYRRGLGFRYGRAMQIISGVHFNFSLPGGFWPAYSDVLGARDDPVAFRSDAYLGLVRNFRRFGWFVLYLFGASPALCKSFLGGHNPGLDEFDPETFYHPYATSLRMSDLGYKNQNQASLLISADTLDGYIADLTRAVTTVNPDYEKIGVVVDGQYRQLNANNLQIENEYYSTIRPKRVAWSGERPTKALRRGGVEYVEVRALDVSAFDPAGVNQNQLRFLEAFLLYCLLENSPPIGQEEQAEIDANHGTVAHEGRRPGVELRRDGRALSLTDWARELLDEMEGVCALLDGDSTERAYSVALEVERQRVAEPELTPSAQILEEMRVNNESFFAFGLRMSELHKTYFTELQPLDEPRSEQLEHEAAQSLQRQREIEEQDEIGFDEYLKRYFADLP